MGVRALCRFAQLVDNVFWRRLIGVAHAEVDDILAPMPRRHFQIIDLIKDVGRQAIDA